MNAADAFNAARMRQLRSHIAIVHHVPGRIRVRLDAALRHRSLGIDRAPLQGLFAAVGGIQEVHINPSVGSVVIQYDPHWIAPEDWETLVQGDDTQARVLFDRWLAGGSRMLRNRKN